MTKDGHRGLLQDTNLLSDHVDGLVVIGEAAYETRPGRPLRPYSLGLLITIEKKVASIMLEDADRAYSAWCEVQFELSAVPNLEWLRTLHKNLLSDWNRDRPFQIRSRLGFDVNFEGDLMALRCRTFQLKADFGLLKEAINDSNEYHRQQCKGVIREIAAKKAAREEVITQVHDTSIATMDLTVLGYAEWFKDRSADLAKDFRDLPLI